MKLKFFLFSPFCFFPFLSFCFFVFSSFIFPVPVLSQPDFKIQAIYGGTAEPAPAFDNNPDTCTIFKKPPKIDAFQFIIGLNRARNLTSISLNIKDSFTPEKISIETSFEVVGFEKYEQTLKQTKISERELKLELISPVFTQFIKLTLYSSTYTNNTIQICEIKVTGTEAENKVTDIKVTEVTETSAIILFKTLLPADAQVRYGPYGPSYTNVNIAAGRRDEHSMKLEKLLKGTDYFFQIVLPESKVETPFTRFRTLGEPLPIITKINLYKVETTKASFKIDSNTQVNFTLQWGYSQNEYTNSTSSAALVMQDDFPLENLTPKTRYYFVVEAKDKYGNSVKSEQYAFDTLPINYALHKEVTGTFSNELSHDPYITRVLKPSTRAVDGDETYFDGFAKSYPPSQKTQWIAVDIGQEAMIDKIVVVWSATAYPSQYNIYVSKSYDPKDWTLIKAVTLPPQEEDKEVITRNSEKGDPLREYSYTVGKSIRRVKIEIPKDTKIHTMFDWDIAILAEIKILS